MNHFLRCGALVRGYNRFASSRKMSSLPWATVDPWKMGGSTPAQGQNLLAGEWVDSSVTKDIIDPLNGETMVKLPDVQMSEIAPYVESMKSCPKSGLHNPMKNVERYVEYGDINARIAREMHNPEVEEFFTKLIQRVVPKHDAQARSEVRVCRKWLEGYSGDQVRNLGRSFGLPGDRLGQQSNGYRFPFGAVSVITPFNFPMEIPLLQTFSALFMGNRCTTKVDWRVSIVMEQFFRFAIHNGLPAADLDFVHCDGPVFNEILVRGDCRNTLFTGSQAVAEKLAVDLRGKVKLEDAGYDWKILGPDVREVDYVAWQADQDAYAFSGQKCSAQSMLFAHSNWMQAGIVDKLASLAARRSLSDFTCGPVLSWNNAQIAAHIDAVLKIPGAKLLFGGKPLEGHSIPTDVYGAYEPTAVFVPLEQALSPEWFPLVTTELFGPFQIVTEYSDEQLPTVLTFIESLENFLTAAVVSNDLEFQTKVLGHTINGTTYAGIRARTTGAPQQHWFGPCGDPRGAGIHTPEAIKLVWSGHREIIQDNGLVGNSWEVPAAT